MYSSSCLNRPITYYMNKWQYSHLVLYKPGRNIERWTNGIEQAMEEEKGVGGGGQD
jgi:hypothetical protein